MDTTRTGLHAKRLRDELLRRVASGELAPGETVTLAPPEDDEPLPVVEGYEVIERAAAGGMGVVYTATARESGRRVALKLVRPDQRTEVAAERILREVHALSAVEHPGIVAYIDHGVTASGIPYLATEWLTGVDLEERLRHGPLLVDEVLALAERLTGALAAAHEWGVVHRDIKPANILLVDGRPEDARLLDFGIARFRVQAWTLTSPGKLIGTPAYMSPEQARGDPNIDHRADLFSLGCVLYECITGQPAFPGEHVMAVLSKVLVESPRPLAERVPHVPPGLRALVQDLLIKDPDERIPSAHVAWRRLQALQVDRHEAPESSPDALTEQEQAFHSTLLLRGDVDTSMPPVHLAQVAHEHLGRYITLVDGTRLIHMQRTHVASDQAANAARCALALREHVPHLAIALVSGRALVTEHAVVGQVLDRGAELLSWTAEGCIRVDEVTTRLLDPRFVIDEDHHGPILTGSRDRVPGARRLLGQATPLVGRSRELAFLEAAFDECVEEPCASALVVVGEAGVGKSRLRHELVLRLKARADPAVTLLMGQADPMRTQAPFSVMARVVHAEVGLSDGEPAVVRGAKLRARLGRHVAPSDLERVVLYLGELVSANQGDPPLELARAREDSSTMRERIQAAWITWLRAECKAQPVVLILEDLHWGDAATVQLVDVLLETLAGVPLLVLAFARPGVHERFVDLWRWRDIEVLELAPLPQRAVRKLVRGVLGDAVSEPDIERIAGCGRGNALLVEELIRTVAEGSGHELRDSVIGMMQSRLEALGARERQVLRAASVMGTTTWRGAIHTLLGQPSDMPAFRRSLATLVEQEWLLARPRTYIPNEEEFSFRHALVRDAAYATLTEEDRQLGHRLAAQWLEQSGEHEPIVIAEHYQRGMDHEAAAPWFSTAADLAFERNEYEVVRQIAERGLSHCPPGSTRGRLLLRQAEVHALTGRHHAAVESALAALEDLPPNSPAWYSAAGEAALASGRVGDPARVSQIVETLMKIQPSEGGSAVNFMGLVRAALPLAAAGEAVTAWWLLDTIVRVTSTMIDTDPEARGPLHSARSLRALVTGALGTAYKEIKVAAAAFERVGSHRNALEHFVGAGFFLLELGCVEQAETILRRTIERAAGLGLEHLSAVARHNLGRRIGEQGRLAEGLELEHEALVKFQRHANTRMQGLTSCHIAWLLLIGGHPEESAAHVNAALELLEDHPASRLIALATRAQILMRIGDRAESLLDARDAIKGLGSIGRVMEGESFIRLTWAEALWANERLDEAREAIVAARANLVERAERIVHEELRHSFRTNVPENARIEALARQWLEVGEGEAGGSSGSASSSEDDPGPGLTVD
ncbi:MAG: protein kinase [Myxococcota bacterium]